jgi:hypothetical protein
MGIPDHEQAPPESPEDLFQARHVTTNGALGEQAHEIRVLSEQSTIFKRRPNEGI